MIGYSKSEDDGTITVWDNSAATSDMTTAQVEDRVYRRRQDEECVIEIGGCTYVVGPPRFDADALLRGKGDKPLPFTPPPVRFQRPPKFQRCPHRLKRSRRKKR